LNTGPARNSAAGDLGWLKALHHFAIGVHGNPNHKPVGNLYVWNDDEIAPGTGFPFHPHRYEPDCGINIPWHVARGSGREHHYRYTVATRITAAIKRGAPWQDYREFRTTKELMSFERSFPATIY
jgi:hypothetical protein